MANSPLDRPRTVAAVMNTDTRPVIEGIYVTRGDCILNQSDVKEDKFFGIVINGKIHWMDYTFAYLREVAKLIKPLNITMNSKGSWGFTANDGWTTLNQKVILVSKLHEDIFKPGTVYLRKAEFFKESEMRWQVEDLVARYFTATALDIEYIEVEEESEA